MLEFFRDKSLRRVFLKLQPQDADTNSYMYSDSISNRAGMSMVSALYEIQNFDYDVESRLALELKYGEDL